MKLQSLIRRIVPTLILVAAAGTIHAQVGSGWTAATFSQRFEYESNDVLITISPPPAYFNNGYCSYSNAAGVETFQLLSHHSNRAEIRPNDDYSSGSRQLQADVLITSTSVDQCIHQMFNGPAGPWFLMREETNYNGSLKVAASTTTFPVATNLFGVWFRLNSINDLNSGNAYVYVNGSRVWSGPNPGGTFYTKYGLYGTHSDSDPAKIQFKNAKLFSGGDATKQDFTLSASPSTQSVLVGNGTSYTVSTAFTNTVSDVVYLSISGLPSGATANFSSWSITGSGSSTLTVNTSSSTPTGTYTLTITGATTNSSYITHTATVTLKVQDFSISATPGSQTVASGGTATGTATVTAANGFGGTVTWSASGMPSGATATFNPTSVTGAGSSTWSVALPNTTPSGTYTVTITGTSGGVSHSANVTIIVSDFSISASPASQTVTAGNATTYTVTLGSANGFSSAVNLSASGLPVGATATFNPTSVNPVGSSTLTVNTTAGVTPGTYTFTVTGTSGPLSHADTATLVVTAPVLPTGWTDADIGSVGVAGGASYASPTFTLNGSGSDIWGTADAFNYAYQSTSGDLAMAAHVASQQNTSGWAKAGVMIRESTAANAAYVGVYITPSNGVSMQVRTATGAGAIDLARQTGAVAPYWVKIVRSGSTFSGYSSADGTTWTLVGSTNISMASSATAGLAVCAHNNTALNTSTFDSVTMATYAFFEAEALTVAANTQTFTIINDTNCSGGQFVQLNGTNVNDLIKFLVPGINAGSYELHVGVKDNYNRATVQAYTGKVGGSYNAFGAVFDEYTASATYPDIDLGPWTVSTSDKYVGFNVTGHNASSSSYVIAVDYIELVPQ